MTPWVEMPKGQEAMRVAARDELRRALGGVECATRLLADRAADAWERGLVEALLCEVDRARQALWRLQP